MRFVPIRGSGCWHWLLVVVWLGRRRHLRVGPMPASGSQSCMAGGANRSPSRERYPLMTRSCSFGL